MHACVCHCVCIFAHFNTHTCLCLCVLVLVCLYVGGKETYNYMYVYWHTHIHICLDMCNTNIFTGLVQFDQMCIFSGIRLTSKFIEFYFVETEQWFGSYSNKIWRGNPASSAWTRLREEAHNERLHFIFPYEFAICSQYWNVHESLIRVCAWLCDLRRECHCVVATSDL